MTEKGQSSAFLDRRRIGRSAPKAVIPASVNGCRGSPKGDRRARSAVPVGTDAHRKRGRGPQDTDGGRGPHLIRALLAYRDSRNSGTIGDYGREQLNHGRGIFRIHQMSDESASLGDRRVPTGHFLRRSRSAHVVYV